MIANLHDLNEHAAKTLAEWKVEKSLADLIMKEYQEMQIQAYRDMAAAWRPRQRIFFEVEIAEDKYGRKLAKR